MSLIKVRHLDKETDGSLKTLFPSLIWDSLSSDHTLVAFSSSDNELKGCCTFFIEPKFIHMCNNVGHILDLHASSPDVLAAIVKGCVDLCETECYKVLLCTKSTSCLPSGFVIPSDNVHLSLISSSSDATLVEDLPENLCWRFLDTCDYDQGFLRLLSQLTSVGDVPKDAYMSQLSKIKNTHSHTHQVLLIFDLSLRKVVASGTLFVCNNVGHIEDVVVDKACRGLGLGRILLSKLCSLREVRVTLNSSEENAGFYEKFGFKPSQDSPCCARHNVIQENCTATPMRTEHRT
jgi:glucosamine-phosphate N-acetyltransferase